MTLLAITVYVNFQKILILIAAIIAVIWFKRKFKR